MGKLHIPRLSLKTKKKSAGAAAVSLAVCVVLLAVLIGAVIGRYQHQIKSEGSARAKEFYFTSDFLDGSTCTLAAPTPDPAGGEGSTEVSFTLGNHADGLRFSEVEIGYEVTVKPRDGVTITYGNTNKILGNDAIHDDRVTLSGLKAGETYTVTATGKGGYQKELTAKVRVLSNANQLYQHQETVPGEYTLLTVWNEGETAGDVSITYTAIPDNTNPNMETWSKSNGISQNQTVTIEPHESKVFRFFGGASVIVNGATEKAPN